MNFGDNPLSFREDDETNNNRAQKQFDLALKQKKFALGKLLSTQIIPSNVQSLKFPVGAISKIETNPIEAVKNVVAQKNGKIKLFRNKKKSSK